MEILKQDKYIEEAILELKANIELPDIKIEYTHICGSPLEIAFKNGYAHITYSKRVELFRGLSLAAGYTDSACYKITQKSHFNSCGAMFDNSRNAVLNMQTAKKMIRIMALMGLDTIMLYTEDTYEIPEYPYFGYMRGRYTTEELKELDEYASGFGIELVPCIQTLAHMNQALRWDAFSEFLDINDILLVGEEKTYKFIEAMIKACRKSFSSKRIHIGMDEAGLVGSGKFREKNGYVNKYDILLDHLKKTVEICKKYDFEPMIWSDMFVNEAFGKDYNGEDKSAELKKELDPQLTLVHWTYYMTDKNVYNKKISCHKKLTDNVAYAGGAVKWIGFTPSINKSIARSRTGLTASLENGVKDVFVTAWGDFGGEASPFCVLPELQLYAEFNYNPYVTNDEIAERLKVCTGEKLQDMLKLEKPNFPEGEYDTDCITTTKYLLYNDLLCGLFDLQIGENYSRFYAELSRELLSVDSKNISYVYKTLGILCRIISKKCEISLKLQKAYLSGDREEVKRLILLAEDVLCDVKEFHTAVYNQWTADNKIFGYEVQDIRLGALETRIGFAIKKLGAWVNGDIERVEELEEKRLPYNSVLSEGGMREVNENQWTRIVSAGLML